MQTETHLPHSRVLRDWQKVKAAPQGTTVYASFVLSGSGLGKPKRPPSLGGEGMREREGPLFEGNRQNYCRASRLEILRCWPYQYVPFAQHLSLGQGRFFGSALVAAPD